MYVAIFENIRAVVKAEELCRADGIAVTVMPVPESISSECGMCLRIDTDGDIRQFETTMRAAAIKYTVHDKI